MANDDSAGRVDQDILTWRQFSGGRSVFNSLLSIQDFAVAAWIPPLPEVNNVAFAETLSASMYDHALRAVQTAGFYNEEELKLGSRAGQSTVAYVDDKYDFALHVDDDSIVVRRDGSRLEDFHDWYSRFGTPLSALIAGVLDELKRQTGRNFTVFKANFQFSFILHDLRSTESHERIRNAEVMRRLVRGMPSDGGKLEDGDDVFNSAGRIDVNISRWVLNHNGIRRIERYKVEAPANKNGAGLWFTFGYGGETYKPSDSEGNERQSFAHRDFFAEYDFAYADFLRDKAVLSFMTQLLDGISFKSTSGHLP